MFIAYIDASGEPYLKDPENYVLSSIIISENQWQKIDNFTRQIKINHFPNSPVEDIELHAKDMMNRDGIFKNLSFDTIYLLLDDVFDFISNPKTELTIISSLINKQKAHKKLDIQQWGYKLLFERLNIFLSRRNRELVENGQSNSFGIMIMDTEGFTKDQKIRNKLNKILKEGTFFQDLEYLIEDPMFTDSKWRNLSQLADCVAYAVRKRFRTTNKPGIHTDNWNRYYEQIVSKFDNRNGDYMGCGLKIFPDL